MTHLGGVGAGVGGAVAVAVRARRLLQHHLLHHAVQQQPVLRVRVVLHCGQRM